MDLNELSYSIIGAAMEVHRELGPGLLEKTYEACLRYELEQPGHTVQTQVAQPVRYKEISLDTGYRIDMIVDETVIVEIKSVEFLLPVHEAQLLSYLKLSNKKLGLLINFNTKYLKDGIRRKIN